LISKTRFKNLLDSWEFSLSIFIIVGLLIFIFIPRIAESSLDQAGVLRIITIFVIANSLFSLIFPLTFKREALFGKRYELVISLISIWISVFLVLAEVIRGEPYVLRTIPDIPNLLTKIAIISWGFGIFQLLRFAYRVITLDVIRFDKINLKFTHNKPTNWGYKIFDDMLRNPEKDIYFPIYIIGNEDVRPWKILQRFLLSGIGLKDNTGYNTGGIYFTFTRPAEEIVEMLEREWKKIKSDSNLVDASNLSWQKIVIIDCYSLNVEKELWNDNITKDVKVYIADSRDPHQLNKNYEKALRFLKEDRKCLHIRVVYDAISDFLTFTDLQLASQYLRHNMGFEQRQKIESLYLFRKGTIPKDKEQYFLWFANGTLELTRTEPSNGVVNVKGDFRGPFIAPKLFTMDYNYELVN